MKTREKLGKSKQKNPVNESWGYIGNQNGKTGKIKHTKTQKTKTGNSGNSNKKRRKNQKTTRKTAQKVPVNLRIIPAKMQIINPGKDGEIKWKTIQSLC